MVRDVPDERGSSVEGRSRWTWTLVLASTVLLLVSMALMVSSVDDGEVRSVADGDNSYMDDALYLGSGECADCHEDQGDRWYTTPHAGAFGPATEETVVGDWTAEPEIEVAPGVNVSPTLIENATGFFMDLDGEGTHVYQVTHVQGAGKWLQVYLTEHGNSRYILPFAWANTVQAWVPFHTEEWFDDEGTPMMAGKHFVWDLLCVACHTVGAQVEHNSTSGEWTATWEEEGVACEACHGPGSLHKKPPSGEERTDYIWRTEDSAVCGNCHTGMTSVGTVGGTNTIFALNAEGRTIRPGDPHDEFFVHNPDLHPDGETVKGQAMQYDDYITSRHSHSLTTLKDAEGREDFCLMCHSTDYKLAAEGEEPTLETALHDIECALCHDMHGTNEENNLRLDTWNTCVQCHRNGDIEPPEEPLPSQKEMVMGTIPVDGLQWFPWMEGEVECVDCHMPTMGVREVPYDIPSHTWHFIEPSKSVDLGMPNSCTVSCHHAGSEEGVMTDERASEWVEEWKANTRTWMDSAEWNLSIAEDRLNRAEDLGFGSTLIEDMNDTYNEAAWVLAFVKRDASMVHNPDFYEYLLSHVHDEAVSISQNLTPGRVQGFVKDADGKAVQYAEVRKDDKVWGTTSGDGSFDFEIAPGEHTFDVYKGDKRETTFTASVTAGTTEDVGTVKLKSVEDEADNTLYILVALVVIIVIILALVMMGRRQNGD